MTNVTCGLTAKKPGSVPFPVLVIEYGTTWLFSACVITLLMTGVFYNILCILLL